MDQLADWYLRWTEEMLTRNPHAIYSGEEGGMLEAWARLYQLTGEEKYHTLTERYSDPGLFRKLRAGAHKKWGTKTRDFWCCHGTMVQAQCLYPELIYMADAEAKRLMVCQYIPSSVETVIGDTKISLVQTAGMKYYNDQAFFDENDHSQTSRWAVNFAVTVEEQREIRAALAVFREKIGAGVVKRHALLR